MAIDCLESGERCRNNFRLAFGYWWHEKTTYIDMDDVPDDTSVFAQAGVLSIRGVEEGSLKTAIFGAHGSLGIGRGPRGISALPLSPRDVSDSGKTAAHNGRIT